MKFIATTYFSTATQSIPSMFQTRIQENHNPVPLTLESDPNFWNVIQECLDYIKTFKPGEDEEIHASWG